MWLIIKSNDYLIPLQLLLIIDRLRRKGCDYGRWFYGQQTLIIYCYVKDKYPMSWKPSCFTF